MRSIGELTRVYLALFLALVTCASGESTVPTPLDNRTNLSLNQYELVEAVLAADAPRVNKALAADPAMARAEVTWLPQTPSESMRATAPSLAHLAVIVACNQSPDTAREFLTGIETTLLKDIKPINENLFAKSVARSSEFRRDESHEGSGLSPNSTFWIVRHLLSHQKADARLGISLAIGHQSQLSDPFTRSQAESLIQASLQSSRTFANAQGLLGAKTGFTDVSPKSITSAENFRKLLQPFSTGDSRI